MTNRWRILILSLLFTCRDIPAWEILTDDLDLDCYQTDSLLLNCSYRLLKLEKPFSISASYKKESLSIRNNTDYPSRDGITAIILLIDTSDPARQPVIEQNKKQVLRILGQSEEYHRIGLAAFDKGLQTRAPFGADRESIINASGTLEAKGMTTELFRSTLKAVEQLADIDAERKAIYIFSDGLAEDRAYFHEDVVRAARRHNVVINSLGFERTPALSVALQTLRRLSEETGGIYVEADKNHALPASFLERPFENIDKGGQFSIDINALSSLPVTRTDIRLDFAADKNSISVDIPVNLPGTPPVKADSRPQQAAPQAASPVQIVTTPVQKEAGKLDRWLWYGVPVALLFLVLLTMITLLILLRKPTPGRQSGQESREQFKPYAYLISQDEKATRYPVTRTTWRIGRSRDNEMTLDDNSVSRRHAEIQRLENGNFMIYDHDSLNGIFINGEKVTKQKLNEGDIIEIGDFYLRFTEYPADYQLGEDTVLQKTRAPSS